MSITQNSTTRWAAARADRRARRAIRDERRALAQSLASYDSPSDRIDMYALLDTYDDADTADIRRLLAVTHAA